MTLNEEPAGVPDNLEPEINELQSNKRSFPSWGDMYQSLHLCLGQSSAVIKTLSGSRLTDRTHLWVASSSLPSDIRRLGKEKQFFHFQ